MATVGVGVSSAGGRMKLWGWWVTAIFMATLLGGLSVWATFTVFKPLEDPLTMLGYTFVEVRAGEVGSSVTLNTVAQWELTAIGANRAAGIVTSVNITPGDEAAQGTKLFTVDLRPVVVALGEVPAFRTISLNTVGPDVAQLQTMLSTLGYYSGKADGKSGANTVTAIKAWQKSLGVKNTGAVEIADIIFVPTLPTRISLDTSVIKLGAVLTGGEDAVHGLPTSPVFSIFITDAQGAMMAPGTAVEVSSPAGGVWHAVVGDHARDPQSNSLVIGLKGAENEPVCGNECGLIPASDEVSLRSEIVTVAPLSGLVVPSAALLTDANGSVAVITDEGTRIPVTIIGSAKGMTVIEGVDQGVQVQVLAALGDQK